MDFFDLFVAGWFWKTHETRGLKRGRLACASGEGTEAVLNLWDQGFRMGADTSALARMQGASVQQLFQWQAAFAQEGLCHPGALQNANATPLPQLFQRQEVFLAEAYPRDVWRLHGNETVQLAGVAAHPEDLGVTTLPKGISPWVDGRGQARAETGGGAAATRIWWFAVPSRSHLKPLALKLAQHL